MKEKDKLELWRKKWPRSVATHSTYPYGKIPIAECLKKHAKSTPNKTAMNFYGREITFREWDEAADRLATAIADRGYKKGDSVLLYMHNSPQVAIAYIAAARLGLIIFTADPSFKEYELEYEVFDSGAKLVFAFDQNYSQVKPLREKNMVKDVIISTFQDYLPEKPTLSLPEMVTQVKQTFPDALNFLDLIQQYPPNPPKVDIDMDEEELVLYTGGTTGLPKGCVHSHEATLKSGAHAYQVRELGYDFTPCNSVLVIGPMGHIGALSYAFFPSCVHGRTMVILVRYDPVTALQAIEKYKIELFIGTVILHKGLLGHPNLKQYNLSSVKLWMTGEWMVWLSPDLAKQWEDAVGRPLVKWGFGMSEVANVMPVGTRVGYEIPFKDTFLMGTVPPDEGIDIRIADFDTHEDLPTGKQGEIVLKSPARCKYYWKKPKETALALSPEGWFYTGDMGMLDEEGYLYWHGRKKYLIRVSGFQVSPGELEMIGRKNPDIANIAVIGIPDEKKGEIPKAFVQLTPGSNSKADQIEGWFKKHISSYKVPKVEIRKELPLTPKGSIDMKRLVEEKPKGEK